MNAIRFISGCSCCMSAIVSLIYQRCCRRATLYCSCSLWIETQFSCKKTGCSRVSLLMVPGRQGRMLSELHIMTGVSFHASSSSFEHAGQPDAPSNINILGRFGKSVAISSATFSGEAVREGKEYDSIRISRCSGCLSILFSFLWKLPFHVPSEKTELTVRI